MELFEFTTSAAGNLRFSAPSGQHDDAVMALALAHHAFAGVQITGEPAYGVHSGVSPRRESVWHTIV